jgi:predicted ATPase/DNA-binding winged helix-turn-helix (wHTH) protein
MTIAPSYLFPPCTLVPAQRLLLCGGVPARIGSRAFDVLLALVERRDRVVTKDELIELAWPGRVVEQNNLQVQVMTLRKLLGHHAIATVPGRGYRFTLPVTVAGDPVADSDSRPALTPVAAAAGPAGPGRLPPWLPPLLGREDDLRELLAVLDAQALVTVCGPGGIGKTRLAQAAAAARADAWPGGVGWVDLAPLADPALLGSAVAQALGARIEGGRQAQEAVIAALQASPALLVLDNAEHLLDGVLTLLADLRGALPKQRVLVTSQEPLHAADEHVFRLEPLAVPAGDEAGQVEGCGAVALFVARAQAADHRFVLDDSNRADVAEICRRLDGMPLAIELAAARVPLLGVSGLRQRLDQRLRMLISGDRPSVRRHHTLRAALEWSHQLLAAPEQAVLRRLGVFPGGFAIDSAQAVADDEQGIDAWEVIEHLGALVDKSLVVAEGGPVPRYRLLETTRLFALERLIEASEAAAVRTRHRDHLVGLAETAREQMLVGDPRGLAWFDLERDNLLLGLAWPHGDDDGTLGLRLAAATRYYWTSRGQVAAGLRAMRQALARPQAQGPSIARCQVLGTSAHFAGLSGQVDDAVRDGAEAVATAREVGDARTLCLALCATGFVHLRRGEQAAAADCAREALALGRGFGDGHELGNAIGLAAAMHMAAGERDEALRLQEEGVAMRERLNQPWSEAVGRLNLAHMALERGDVDAVPAQLRRVLGLLPRIDSQYVGVHLLGVTSEWAAASGRAEDAVLLDAACAAQRARVGLDDPRDPSGRARLAQACDTLAPPRREQLEASGRALPYDDLLQRVRDTLG